MFVNDNQTLAVREQEIRAALFRRLASLLEQQSVAYVVLGNTENFPREIHSDVDFMVGQTDLRRVVAVLRQVADEASGRMVQMLRHETTAGYFAIAVQNGPTVFFVHPDYCTDYRRGGRLWLRCQDVLAERRYTTKGFFVPSPEHSLRYYLIKRLDKGAVTDDQARYLEACFADDVRRGQLAVVELLGKGRAGELVLRALSSGDWSEVRSCMRTVRQAIHARPPLESTVARIFQSVREIRRVADRIIWPTGLCIAVLGPDGAGKSSLIDRLRIDMAQGFRLTHDEHLQPNFLKRGGKRKVVTDPHGQAPRGTSGSLLKLAYFVADYVVGYHVKIRPKLVKSTLMVFDRYYHDILVDPIRYRFGAPTWVARVASLLIPKPDLWIILDAPADILQQRKQEVSLSESERQRNGYRRMAMVLPNAVLVDASETMERTLAEAYTAIIEKLGSRTDERLARMKLG